MASWRTIKGKALGHVHKTFVVPAVYLTHAAGTPLRVGVRVHTKQSRVENEFTWPNGPGFLELEPKLIFNASEVAKPANLAFVFVSPTEIYRLGPSRPHRDGYIAVDVTEAKDADVATAVATFEADGYDEDIWGGIYP